MLSVLLSAQSGPWQVSEPTATRRRGGSETGDCARACWCTASVTRLQAGGSGPLGGKRLPVAPPPILFMVHLLRTREFCVLILTQSQIYKLL